MVAYLILMKEEAPQRAYPLRELLARCHAVPFILLWGGVVHRRASTARLRNKDASATLPWLQSLGKLRWSMKL